MWLLYNIEILRALRFKSSYAFLKRPPGLLNNQTNNGETIANASRVSEICNDFFVNIATNGATVEV